ncbi:MAG: hypothetical protein M3R17_03320 [Bacteroidota bacterium]|nr:hypothetical protein [Bacteroidota bacterium]
MDYFSHFDSTIHDTNHGIVDLCQDTFISSLSISALFAFIFLPVYQLITNTVTRRKKKPAENL